MDGLASGGVCIRLFGGLLAVSKEGLRPLELLTWPGLEPSSPSEFGPVVRIFCTEYFVVNICYAVRKT